MLLALPLTLASLASSSSECGLCSKNKCENAKCKEKICIEASGFVIGERSVGCIEMLAGHIPSLMLEGTTLFCETYEFFGIAGKNGICGCDFHRGCRNLTATSATYTGKYRCIKGNTSCTADRCVYSTIPQLGSGCANTPSGLKVLPAGFVKLPQWFQGCITDSATGGEVCYCEGDYCNSRRQHVAYSDKKLLTCVESDGTCVGHACTYQEINTDVISHRTLACINVTAHSGLIEDFCLRLTVGGGELTTCVCSSNKCNADLTRAIQSINNPDAIHDGTAPARTTQITTSTSGVVVSDSTAAAGFSTKSDQAAISSATQPTRYTGTRTAGAKRHWSAALLVFTAVLYSF